MVKCVTCPSFAKSVPIGLSTIGALFGGTGVGVGMALVEVRTDDVDKDVMLVSWTAVDEKDGVTIDVSESVMDGEIMEVVVGGAIHIKSLSSNPVTMHTSSGSLQGLGSQGENVSAQSSPVNPGRHSHINSSKRRLIQVALLKHGSGSQSSMSTEQRSPVKPA